jgi:1,4-dihydroxy-6-naphthoate synthase
MAIRLSLAYSPCPNDTFLFYALAHRRIDLPDIDFGIHLEDVETLNRAAARGSYAISKLSFGALGHLQQTYGLLRSGAALGRGCGPILVARPGFEPEKLTSAAVAVPGMWTTARLLLGLYAPEIDDPIPMPFDRIMPAVADKTVEAGVIIHEGRFTYPAYGLVNITDLGQWWEKRTGLPIPLGGIAVRRDLGAGLAGRIEGAIRDSVARAFDHPGEADAYIRAHAQEMDPEVVRQHIDLYVNQFTLDLGREGEDAVSRLFAEGRAAGFFPETGAPLFACDNQEPGVKNG